MNTEEITLYTLIASFAVGFIFSLSFTKVWKDKPNGQFYFGMSLFWFIVVPLILTEDSEETPKNNFWFWAGYVVSVIGVAYCLFYAKNI